MAKDINAGRVAEPIGQAQRQIGAGSSLGARILVQQLDADPKGQGIADVIFRLGPAGMVHIAHSVFIAVIGGRKPQPVGRSGIDINAPQILIPGGRSYLPVQRGKPLCPLFEICANSPIGGQPQIGQPHPDLRLDRGASPGNGGNRVDDQPAIGGKCGAKPRPIGARGLQAGIGCVAVLIQQIDADGGLIGGSGLFNRARQADAQLVGQPPFYPPASGVAVDIASGGRIFVLHHQHDLCVAQRPVGHNPAVRTALQRLRQGYDPLDIVDLVIPACGQASGLQDATTIRITHLNGDGFGRGGDVLFVQKIHRPAGAPERIALRQHVGLGGIQHDLRPWLSAARLILRRILRLQAVQGAFVPHIFAARDSGAEIAPLHEIARPFDPEKQLAGCGGVVHGGGIVAIGRIQVIGIDPQQQIARVFFVKLPENLLNIPLAGIGRGGNGQPAGGFPIDIKGKSPCGIGAGSLARPGAIGQISGGDIEPF